MCTELEQWYADQAEALKEESKELYEKVRRYIKKSSSKYILEWDGLATDIELLDGVLVKILTVAEEGYWFCPGSIEIDGEYVECPDFTKECDELVDIDEDEDDEEEYYWQYQHAYEIVAPYITWYYLVHTLKHIRDYVEKYADFYNKLAEEGEENADTDSQIA